MPKSTLDTYRRIGGNRCSNLAKQFVDIIIICYALSERNGARCRLHLYSNGVQAEFEQSIQIAQRSFIVGNSAFNDRAGSLERRAIHASQLGERYPGGSQRDDLIRVSELICGIETIARVWIGLHRRQNSKLVVISEGLDRQAGHGGKLTDAVKSHT